MKEKPTPPPMLPAGPNEDRPPAPYIPLLDLANEILDPDDPQLIGQDLVTYFNYPGIAENHALIPAWWGKAADGTSVDFGGKALFVKDIEPGLGFKVMIASETIEKLRNGHVFYSFLRDTDYDNVGDIESFRIEFDIKKPGQSGLLAPIFKQSHQHYVDPLASDEFLVAVLPYNRMRAGDTVTLYWNGKRSSGAPINEKTFPLDITDEHLGKVLVWALRGVEFTPIKNGEVTLHHEIKYVSGEPDSASAKRRFDVVKPVAKELPWVTIKDLEDDATLIDLGLFPDGLLVSLPIGQLVRVGDGVLLYCSSVTSGAPDMILHGTVDESEIGKPIEFHIPFSWLVENNDGDISLRYQYLRHNASESGMSRPLHISKQLDLGLPSVDGMQPQPDGSYTLDPMTLGSAAYIRLPENLDIPTGATVTAHWKTADGRVSFDNAIPYSTEPLRFEVPLTTVANSLGQVLLIDYDVNGQRSPLLELRIGVLTDHPSIDCFGTGTGNPPTVSQALFPYDVRVNKWKFIAIGQVLKIWLEQNGKVVAIDERSVWGEEVEMGVFTKLELEHVAGLSLGSTFSIWASVSFDGGATFLTFKKPRALKLLA